jgi:cob(I)alamin adenosyltransferase
MRITKVVTKFGDKGRTRLADGSIVSKTSIRVASYGSVDELNSFIGYGKSLIYVNKKLKYRNAISALLSTIQKHLFILGADLSTPPLKQVRDTLRVSAGMVDFLTKKCEFYNKKLAPLKEFILPSGSLEGAYFHVLRSVARMAERAVVRLADKEKINDEIIRYLNRLSDLLFILARFINKELGFKERLIDFRKIMKKYGGKK